MRNRLEKIQRGFLWGNIWEDNKMHLVSWSKVCKEKKSGDLDIRRLEILNWALLGKWLWRFTLKREN